MTGGSELHSCPTMSDVVRGAGVAMWPLCPLSEGAEPKMQPRGRVRDQGVRDREAGRATRGPRALAPRI